MQIFDDVIEGFLGAIGAILGFVIFAFLCITMPLWIVPYLIYKKVKKRKADNG